MSENETSRFEDLGLSEASLKAIAAVGYTTPSPIQAAFIPVAVSGEDCIGQAQTGTGKTAAFSLPILERIDFDSSETQAIVLTPTRELSEQVSIELDRLSLDERCRVACLVGGRRISDQLSALKRGVQVVIGTPGRVLDLISRRALDLSNIKIAVLDEADRMLDIGFRPDIEKILRRCPTDRQTLLLSATLPAPVERLAQRYMRDPKRIDLSQENVVGDSVEQYYLTVDADRKFPVLAKLLARVRPQQALVFTRTKRGADDLHRRFSERLPDVALIHGDLPQPKRDSVMRRFRAGQVRLLIATDVVGRGIDVCGISHIFNYDVPEYSDDYVHRIGRTGRISSDEKGYAFTFITPGEGNQLTGIEMRINRQLPEYKLDGYEAFRPSKRRRNVNDVESPAPAGFGVM